MSIPRSKLQLPGTDKGKVDAERRNAAPSRSSKRTWKKPKGMPKRPLSAYNLFFAEERRRLLYHTKEDDSSARESNGRRKRKIGFAGLARAVAAKWKSLDPGIKEELQRKSELDRLRYKKEVQEWEQKVSALQEDHWEENSRETSSADCQQDFKIAAASAMDHASMERLANGQCSRLEASTHYYYSNNDHLRTTMTGPQGMMPVTSTSQEYMDRTTRPFAPLEQQFSQSILYDTMRPKDNAPVGMYQAFHNRMIINLGRADCQVRLRIFPPGWVHKPTGSTFVPPLNKKSPPSTLATLRDSLDADEVEFIQCLQKREF